MELFWSIAGIVTLFKVLLLPSYYSTDFEVHRNWLAITHSLPCRQWYLESTSQWTFDYPPLFAWFECLLSQIAQLFDRGMLHVANLNYASDATVLFQRLSVIITDLLYVYAVRQFTVKCMSVSTSSEERDIFYNPRHIAAVLFLTNFGLLIVDHIHFQYNGFLFGILLLSFVRIIEGRLMEAAFLFSVLLNLKHIYLYIAPAFFVYLLRLHCFLPASGCSDSKIAPKVFSLSKFASLSSVVAMVFLISFGPFVLMGQLMQVLSRLFPFRRGLCHAYWAPNFWAVYNVVDKLATVTGTQLKLIHSEGIQQASMTSGLVQEYSHNVLPSVSPWATLALTAFAMMPALVNVWRNPDGVSSFLHAVVMCALASFLFGWHVHEKAILLIIIPMIVLVFMDKKRYSKIFLILSTVGHYSLFPLIFTSFESVLKITLLLMSTVYSFMTLGSLHSDINIHDRWLPLLSRLESVYIIGIVPLEVYNSLLHSHLPIAERWPFLPLLLTSVYCSVGILYCWVCLSVVTVQSWLKKLKIS